MLNKGAKMQLIKRYDTEINAWVVGYWRTNTTFIVVDIVDMLDDAERLYGKAA